MRNIYSFIYYFIILLFYNSHVPLIFCYDACAVDHLKANILELFLAGSETTSNTLLWGIYLLSINPEAQRAMQEELDRVVGRDHMPTLAHMDRWDSSFKRNYTVGL